MIRPGEIWRDYWGNPITVRSGSVIHDDGVWWWFGVHDGDRLMPHGIRAYASTDLVRWHDHGLVLAADGIPGGELDSPKVIRCPRTGGLIVWFHLVMAETVGVAYALSPGEPFGFLHGLKGRGRMTRDLTLFDDDEGSVWHVFGRAGENAWFIARLDEFLTGHRGEPVRVGTDGVHRSPVVMKWDDCYWLLTTASVDGSPGEAILSSARSMDGPWEAIGNPCIGSNAQLESFFNARPCCLVPVSGCSSGFVLVADGVPFGAEAGRHVWLPVDFRHGVPELRWCGAWRPVEWGLVSGSCGRVSSS